MRQRRFPWKHTRFVQRLFHHAGLIVLLSFAALLTKSCRIKEGARITKVYGKVTDQAGQPVDSVTILFAGTIGLSAGFPIKETLTDSSGSYELVVDVPRKYHSAGISLSLRIESLRSRYSTQNQLIYENGVQKGSCCFVAMGGKTKYDFVLLPK